MSRRTLLGRAAAAAAGLLSIDALRGESAAAAGFPMHPHTQRRCRRRGSTWRSDSCRALVPGMRERRSLAGRLNGLMVAPPPADPAHHWPSVANSALAEILRLLFPTAPSSGLSALDCARAALRRRGAAAAPARDLRAIGRAGVNVARHVFGWSRTDGGHEGFHTNFPPYEPPSGPGQWVPTAPAFSRALQPFWGANRPFCSHRVACQIRGRRFRTRRSRARLSMPRRTSATCW